MVSDSDTAVPTQQSVKAYVDVIVGSSTVFKADKVVLKALTLIVDNFQLLNTESD